MVVAAAVFVLGMFKLGINQTFKSTPMTDAKTMKTLRQIKSHQFTLHSILVR
jgi:hypothetical protein